MTDLAPLHPSPILRLSGDIWSLLPNFLDYGDLIRLVSTGCPLLASQISCHGRDLRLSWNLSRFMDFEEVYRTTRHFNNVYSIDFKSSSSELLSWTPINRYGWPSSLISLKLRFLDCIVTFLGKEDLHVGLPNLEVLDLAEEMQKPVARPVNLKGLCPRLRVLRLSSHCRHWMAASHLEYLPIQLEELHIDFLIQFCDEDKLEAPIPVWSTQKTVLPSLPSSVTRIFLQYSKAMAWHIVWSTLPHSLQSLELCSISIPSSPIYVGSFESKPNVTSIEITPTSHARTPNLTTFSLGSSSLPCGDVIQLVPPSVTHFEACLVNSPENGPSIDSVARFIAPMLVSLRCEQHEAFEKIVVSGKISFPKLKKLYGVHSSSKTSIVPPSVTHYESSELCTCPLPETLVSLRGLINLPLLLPLRHLTSLIISNGSLPLDCVNHLPNTLTKLVSAADNLAAAALFNRMLIPGELLSLSELILLDLIDALAISPIPMQLKTLRIQLEKESLSEPFKDDLWHSLKSSQLEDLGIYIHSSFADEPIPAYMETVVIQILNNLPDSLQAFIFGIPCVPSRAWPVKLPSNLLELTLYNFDGGHDSGNDFDDSEPPAFALPANLRLLSIDCLTAWTFKELPPYISLMSCGSAHKDDVFQYFDCKPAPRLGLELNSTIYEV